MNAYGPALAATLLCAASASASDTGLLPTTRGWEVVDGAADANGFKLFRKYSVAGGGFANVVILNCPLDPESAYTHVTFVLPKNFEPSSFPRSEAKPRLTLRVVADGKPHAVEAEYRAGEIYVDYAPGNEEGFRAILGAERLAVSFGDKGDTLRLDMAGTVDRFMAGADVRKALPAVAKLRHRERGDVDRECGL